MKHYHVAAGILRDQAGRVLIAERLCDGPFGGLWEFPGGKILSDERAEDALKRELAEELGIDATSIQPFMTLHHDYADRTVDLEFFIVNAWCGEPRGREGQRLRWVEAAELSARELLPADKPVVDKLRR